MGREQRSTQAPKRFDDEDFGKVKPIKAVQSTKPKALVRAVKLTGFVQGVTAPTPARVDDGFDDGFDMLLSQESVISSATDVVQGDGLDRTFSNISNLAAPLGRSLSKVPGYYHLGDKNRVLEEGQQMLEETQLRVLSQREASNQSSSANQWVNNELARRDAVANNKETQK